MLQDDSCTREWKPSLHVPWRADGDDPLIASWFSAIIIQLSFLGVGTSEGNADWSTTRRSCSNCGKTTKHIKSLKSAPY